VKEKTVKNKIAELRKPDNEIANKLSILNMLPLNMEAPVISNINLGDARRDANVWLAWSAPYGQDRDGWSPTNIFRQLEIYFTLMPACLIKYGGYRRTTHPGALDDIPGTIKSGRYEYDLEDCSIIAPVWANPESYGFSAVRCYMQAECGLIFQVSIDIPNVLIGFNAHRIEYRGGWHYDRQNVRLRFPDSWESIKLNDGEICARHEHCYAAADTDQGLSGAFYWSLNVEQHEFPWKASEFVKLITAKN
jgi:hypothetical protein